MRKIIVLTFISLDGVMQSPGGPEEDPTAGFTLGGWSAPFEDEVSGQLMQEQMQSSDILLGRKTFDIFESFWPAHADEWPGINEVRKYVLSTTRDESDWSNTTFLKSLTDIENLKNSEGDAIKVWGSSKLVQLLLKHDMVDEIWIKIYPVILGQGKKLWDNESAARSFILVENHVTPGGVIFANYRKKGGVEVGIIGE